ncbi:MAG: nitroreductase family protein [Terriglobales bacterium]
MLQLDDFEALVRRRRAIRHFQPTPLPEGVLERLLECARWAPSGYNLQPSYFVVVSDPERKRVLRTACLDQPQVEEAPAVLVISGNARVAREHIEEAVRLDREHQAITASYEGTLRRNIALAFATGPVGLQRIAKWLLLPVRRLFLPTPGLPAVQMRFWLAKQGALCAMNYMLAAEAAGLSTVPMEGFDEARVRKAVGLPRHHLPLLVIPTGYSADVDSRKMRLPLERLAHIEQFKR